MKIKNIKKEIAAQNINQFSSLDTDTPKLRLEITNNANVEMLKTWLKSKICVIENVMVMPYPTVVEIRNMPFTTQTQLPYQSTWKIPQVSTLKAHIIYEQ